MGKNDCRKMSPFHFSGGARARNVVLRLALTWALLAVAEPVFAQPYILPMNDLSRLRWEAAGVGRQAGVHSTALPVLAADVDLSGVEGLTPDTSEYYYTFTRKLFGSHLVELDKPGLALRGDILIDFA